MIRSIVAAIAASIALIAAQPAAAELRPRLKAEATVTGDLVRVGDLVDHAGIIAKVPIFRAPDLGYTGTVSASDVVEAVRAHALIGLDTGGLTEVRVTRAARAIPASEVEAVVAQALSLQYNLGPVKDLTVTFEREMRAMYVEPTATGEPRVARISYDARNGRFDAALEIPTGSSTRGTLRITGRAYPTVELVTLVHTVERGTVLKDADVTIERRPRAEATPDNVTSRSQVIGMAARNAMQAGRPLRTIDLMRPQVVQRNESVTLIFEMPGIVLTLRGKAMEGGAEGDVISVLNEQSKRTAQGVITGPGRVLIQKDPPRAATSRPPSGALADAR